MKFLLLGLFIAAVAAAPKLRKDENQEVDSIVPGPVILPEPELPVVVPDSVLLPPPELPIIPPGSVILPEPEFPIIPPGSVILPEPEFPVIIPEPGDIPEPELPILPKPELPEIDSAEVPELPPPKPVVPSGEVFNDGIVQVKVHTDTGLLSSVQNWVSLVLNYIKNGIQSTHQILGY